MSRRNQNKPIVSRGVQIVAGLGSSICTPGENNGLLGELVHARNTIAADWIGTRYYAVDYDGGSDENAGFSDVSMAAAGLVPLKTIEELLTRLPRLGMGLTAVVAIKTRAGGAAYVNKTATANDDLNLIGQTGYLNLIVRGTATAASAGSVAFADDANDRIYAGAQIVSGTNAPGYNPVAPFSANTFNVQKVGGGAAALPAEPAIIGKRIRFDVATTTAALRNATAMIWKNGAASMTVGDDLPAVPVGTDVFYIEEPGVAVNNIAVISPNANDVVPAPSFTAEGIQVVGIRSVNATDQAPLSVIGVAAVICSFIDLASTASTSARIFNFSSVSFQRSYTDQTGAVVVTGVGIRAPNIITYSNGMRASFTSSALVSTLGRVQLLGIGQYNVGAGCYCFAGVLHQGAYSGAVADSNLASNLIGRGSTSTVQRLRVQNGAIDGAAIVQSMGSGTILGVDLQNVGTDSLISIRSIGTGHAIADVVGSTGNTGVGLNMSAARDCSVVMTITGNGANTFTAAAGKDILGAGGTATTGPFYVHADYARTDLKDAFGNHIQGAGNTILGTTVLATNDGNADIGQYMVVRATGSGVVRESIATAASTAIAQGVTQSAMTAAGPQVAMLVNAGGTWVQFDAAPTAGRIAYLSSTNAGQATDAVPAGEILQLGRILFVSGTLGYINFEPDTLAADMADATVSTTDATLTTIATIAIPDNTVVLVKADIVGRRTNAAGRAGYIRNALVFREAAGAATLEGAVDTPFTRESSGGYNGTLAVSGNNLLVQVQGIAGHNIDWRVRYTVLEVA